MYLKTLPLLLLSGTLFSQKSTVATGADAQGAGGSMSYSIGLTNYETISSTGTITQGVQQPYEFYAVGIEEWDSDIQISAYPNPLTSQLTVSFSNEVMEEMSFQLTDGAGRLVETGQLESKETFIDVQDLARSNYFLTIYKKDQSVRVYKLVKN